MQLKNLRSKSRNRKQNWKRANSREEQRVGAKGRKRKGRKEVLSRMYMKMMRRKMKNRCH